MPGKTFYQEIEKKFDQVPRKCQEIWSFRAVNQFLDFFLTESYLFSAKHTLKILISKFATILFTIFAEYLHALVHACRARVGLLPSLCQLLKFIGQSSVLTFDKISLNYGNLDLFKIIFKEMDFLRKLLKTSMFPIFT